MQITKHTLKDVPDDTKSSIIEYTYQFKKRSISPLIKCREDDDFQKKLDQANKDFLYYIFHIISIVLRHHDAMDILKKVAESYYSGSLEIENKIISSKEKMRRSDKDSDPPIASVWLNSVRILQNCITHINDPKISFIKPQYYTAILEAYSNISVCATALDMIFNRKVKDMNHNADKLIKVCNYYAERSKDSLEIIVKANKSRDSCSSSSSSRMLDDMNTRMKIAKTTGLETIPKFDPNALFRLDGIIGKELHPLKDKLDSVELVRSLREG